ncbi:UDP-N-acetylglucosamine 1-carboxyvinyltransferase [bacterium]|nr:UDP-N-acetylglucosamine 1-carboxyvinyltransferase [bacterium]
MDKLVIHGGRPLRGEIVIGGSKNAVLPMMAAAMLAEGRYALSNVPRLKDVRTMARLVEGIGVSVTAEGRNLILENPGCRTWEAPYDLVKTMRASIYVLGPLLARYGRAKVSLPGGCAWGPRPVNLHIEGMRKLGADVAIKEGYIVATAGKLKGARILFDKSSVGATANILLAAVLARGTTRIENAAREPEIDALCDFLNRMGGRIAGMGTGHLEIEGVDSLRPVSAEVIPDRIETGTYLVAGHITGGDLTLRRTRPDHCVAVIEKLRESGADVDEGPDWIRVRSGGQIRPTHVVTVEYPGFPTDMQAQWLALMSLAAGTSTVTDTIFHDRFTHVAELQRLGADLTIDRNVCVVQGTDFLSGARVMSTDLRASASLVLAGLVARGRTDISRVYHLDRGYERIEEKLGSVGADIRRESEKTTPS